LRYNQSEIIVRAHGHARYAVRKPVKVNLEVLLFLFFLLLVFLLVLFLAFFCDGYFIAFGWKWVLHIFAQSERVQVLTAIRGKVEFNLADNRLKFMHGRVVEIVAIGVPSDIGCIEKVAGYAMLLSIRDAPYINRAEII